MKLYVCRICAAEFMKQTAAKVCGAECRKEWDRRYQAGWEARNVEHRKKYYAAYHMAHRDERNCVHREQAKLKRLNPAVAERLRVDQRARRATKSRQQLDATLLTRKVMKQWQVDSQQARTWIEQGSFPP